MNHSTIISAEQIWNNLPTQLSKRIAKAKAPLMESLKLCKQPIAKILLTETQVLPPEQLELTQEGAASLEIELDRLIDELAALNRTSLLGLRNQIIILGLVVEAGNQAMLWNLPFPPIPIHRKRERNPFQPKLFFNYEPDTQVKEIIMSSLQNNLEFSHHACIGRLLLSGMVNGGLLQKNAIEALLATIDEPINNLYDVYYLLLPLKFNGYKNQEFRRWFPDAITTFLLLNHNPDKPKTWKHIWPYISSFYNEVGVTPPKNLTSLLTALRFSLKQRVPPFLVEYQSRNFVSHSLHESVWHRLQNLEPKFPNLNTYDFEELTSTLETTETMLVDFQWCFQIKECLKAKTKKAAKQLLEQKFPNLETDDGLTQTIVEWVLYMLKHGSKIGRPLAISTTKGYVTRVLQGLPSLLFDLDFHSLTHEELEEVYIQLLENAESTNLRKHLKKALKEFHQFISNKIPNLKYESSILSTSTELSPVDANIISLEEYLATLKHLEHADLDFIHDSLPEITCIILTLGFRCGLRRSEALKLRIIDIQGTYEPEILVRPHELRRLKTTNSTRRIRLKPLMTQTEIDLLLNLLEKRKRQEKAKPFSQFLFALPDKNQTIISAETVFLAVHRALRAATGDERLRFHHLRHSFASWSFLRLMIADNGMPEHFFKALPKTRAWLENSSQQFKKGLYSHEQPTRKHLYYITTLLGHSNPSISLEHYIHFCDVLTYHAMNKNLQPIPATQWSYTLNIPLSTIYTWLQKGEHQLFRELANENPERYSALQLRKKAKPNKDTDLSPYQQIMNTWKVLYLYSARDKTPDYLADRHGLSQQHVLSCIEAAKEIAFITTNKGTFRHKMMVNDDTDKTRLLCPEKVIDKKGVNLATNFAAKLHNLKLTRPEDFYWITNYFIHNAWSQTADLIFKEPQDAEKYLNILNNLNIKQSEIKLTWYHGKSLDHISNLQRKAYWRESLHLSKNRKLKSKKLNNISKLGEYGWLGIRLVDYLNPKYPEGKSTYAFRFVMLLSAVYLYPKVTGILPILKVKNQLDGG